MPTKQPLPVVRGTLTGADCANCPLAKNGLAQKPVFSESAVDPEWLIIGEGPGHQEVRENRPFCGPSGRLLNQALTTINVDRAKLFVGNATLCLPPPNATDAQKKQAQKCCAPRLNAELAQHPGKPVLALGAIAAQGFLGDKFSITQMAGALFERDVDGTGNRYIIPTVHPAAILRGGAGGGSGAHTVDLLFVNLVYDANKVARLASGKQVVFPDDIDFEINDPMAAQALMEGFAAHVRARRGSDRMIASDIEAVPGKAGTSALEPLYVKMTLLGLATTDWGISIAWHIANARTRKLAKALLEDSSIVKAGHNFLLYDKPALFQHDIDVRGEIHDSMLLHHNAFPGSPHDLQRVATQFFAIPPWKSEHRVDKKFVLHLKDELEDSDEDETEEELSEKEQEKRTASEQKFVTELSEHARYNARDTLASARLVAPLLNAVKNARADKTYAMDIEKARVAEQMHRNGVPISRAVNNALQKQFKAVITRAKKEIEDRVHDPALWVKFIDYLAGEQAKRIRKGDANDYLLRHAKRQQEAADHPPEFMIDSGEHIAAYLKARGVPMLVQTDKGKTSTKRDILESLTHVPEVREILDYREAKKMLSTFVLSVADHMDEHDRIHPRWSVNKITGRWGSEAPQCFDGETEILTEDGWVRFDQLIEGRHVAQWHKSGAINFAVPTAYIKHKYVGEMVRIKRRNIDLLVTPDHRLVLRSRRNQYEDVRADAFVEDRYMPVAGQYTSGTVVWSPSFVALLCAAQADGSWNGSGWNFQFTRQRKIDRLVWALTEQAVPFTLKESYVDDPFKPGKLRRRVRIYVKKSSVGDRLRELLGANKVFNKWILALDVTTLKNFTDEVMLWDGSFTRRSTYSSSLRQNVDWLQAACTLTGRRARIRQYTGSALQKKVNFQVDVVDRVDASTTHADVSRVAWHDDVYCVTVPSSYIVVRRNGVVMVTGNCQNWPKADASKNRPNLRTQVVAPKGRKLVGADFSALEARVIALISGDPFLCGVFAHPPDTYGPGDIHSQFARVLWSDFDTMEKGLKKKTRDIIKRVVYGSLYGADVPTLHAAVSKDYPDITQGQVRKMNEAMKAKIPAVDRYYANLTRQVMQTGELRSFLLERRRTFPTGNADPTDLRNFGVQAAGADIADTGVVRLNKALPGVDSTAMLILQIHDAIVVECDEDRAEDVRDCVVTSLTQTHSNGGLSVLFPVECDIGDDWSQV